MKRSYKIVRILNAIVCIALLVTIMIAAYKEWSMYGRYTVWSFIVSLLIHGTFCGAIYLFIDWVLKRMLNIESDE